MLLVAATADDRRQAYTRFHRSLEDPPFLERAQAALTPPAGSILHKRWNETLTSKELGCTVELPTQEMWVDQVPPHRYRILIWNLTTIPETPA